METATPQHYPFRPPSKQDFSTCSRSLAWLLEIPLQKAQELLARLYGYANLHELQRALQKPGQPGPYEETLLKTEPFAGRTHRTMEVLAQQFAKGNINELPKACWRVRDLHLFSEPHLHRQNFRQLKAEFEVHRGTEQPGLQLDVHDYAELSVSADGKKAHLEFLPLGKAIYDSIESERPEFPAAGRMDHQRYAQFLEDLLRRHPKNPWVIAALFLQQVRWSWVGDWTEGYANAVQDQRLDGLSVQPYDAPTEYAEHCQQQAISLMGRARQAVDLFEQLYGDLRDSAPDSHALRRGFPWDKDFYSYPASLYFAGLVALNAGDLKRAEEWLARNLKIEQPAGDSFGAGFYLAIVRLNTGRGRISTLFPGKPGQYDWGGPENLSVCVEAIEAGNLAKAAAYFSEALISSVFTLEGVTGERKDALTRLTTLGDHDCPARFQEFNHHTAVFRSRRPDIVALLRTVATDPAVADATVRFHQNHSQAIGSATKPAGAEISARVWEREPSLQAALKQAVSAAFTSSATADDDTTRRRH